MYYDKTKYIYLYMYMHLAIYKLIEVTFINLGHYI